MESFILKEIILASSYLGRMCNQYIDQRERSQVYKRNQTSKLDFAFDIGSTPTFYISIK